MRIRSARRIAERPRRRRRYTSGHRERVHQCEHAWGRVALAAYSVGAANAAAANREASARRRRATCESWREPRARRHGAPSGPFPFRRRTGHRVQPRVTARVRPDSSRAAPGGWLTPSAQPTEGATMFPSPSLVRALIVGALSALHPFRQSGRPAVADVPHSASAVVHHVPGKGQGTICDGSRRFPAASEEQPELVCGSGAAPRSRSTTRVTIAPARPAGTTPTATLRGASCARGGRPAFWSNPLTGNDGSVHADEQDHDRARRAGRLRTRPPRPLVGENIYTDPATHKKVLSSVGRTVFGPTAASSSSRASSRSSTRSSTATCPSSTRVCAALA